MHVHACLSHALQERFVLFSICLYISDTSTPTLVSAICVIVTAPWTHSDLSAVHGDRECSHAGRTCSGGMKTRLVSHRGNGDKHERQNTSTTTPLRQGEADRGDIVSRDILQSHRYQSGGLLSTVEEGERG